MDEFYEAFKEYCVLRGWNKDTVEITDHLVNEVTRWMVSMQNPEDITDVDKHCPSC